jgi:hypothetical protein
MDYLLADEWSGAGDGSQMDPEERLPEIQQWAGDNNNADRMILDMEAINQGGAAGEQQGRVDRGDQSCSLPEDASGDECLARFCENAAGEQQGRVDRGDESCSLPDDASGDDCLARFCENAVDGIAVYELPVEIGTGNGEEESFSQQATDGADGRQGTVDSDDESCSLPEDVSGDECLARFAENAGDGIVEYGPPVENGAGNSDEESFSQPGIVEYARSGRGPAINDGNTAGSAVPRLNIGDSVYISDPSYGRVGHSATVAFSNMGEPTVWINWLYGGMAAVEVDRRYVESFHLPRTSPSRRGRRPS